MNNYSGSARGRAGALMHFLSRLPWKQYDIVCFGLAPAATVFGLVLCLCVCFSLIIRGLLRRWSRRLILLTHTQRNAGQVPGCGPTEPNGSHLQSHTATQCSANTQYAALNVRARMWQRKEPTHWMTRGGDAGVFGRQTWNNIQICKTLSSDTDLIFFGDTLSKRGQRIRNRLKRHNYRGIKYSQISHFTLWRAIICQVSSCTRANLNCKQAAMKWTEKGVHKKLSPCLSHWPNQILIQ